MACSFFVCDGPQPVHAETSTPAVSAAADSVAKVSGDHWLMTADESGLYFVTGEGISRVSPQKKESAPQQVVAQKGVRHLVLDGEFLYFSLSDTVRTGDAHKDRILRVPKSGGAAAIVASGLQTIMDFVPDGDSLFVLEYHKEGIHDLPSSGTLARYPKAGGPRAELASGLRFPYALVLDAGYVYFSQLFGNAVTRVAKQGGTPTVVAKAVAAGATDLVVDEANVYFVDNPGDPRSIQLPPQGLRKVPKAGGPAKLLVEHVATHGFGRMLADRATLYLGGYDFMKVSKDGRDPVHLKPKECHAIALDSTSVYCMTNDRILRLPK